MRPGAGEDIPGINPTLNGVLGRKGGSEGGEGRKTSSSAKAGPKGLRGAEERNEGKGGGRGLVSVTTVIVPASSLAFPFSSTVCRLHELQAAQFHRRTHFVGSFAPNAFNCSVLTGILYPRGGKQWLYEEEEEEEVEVPRRERGWWNWFSVCLSLSCVVVGGCIEGRWRKEG